MPRWTTRYGIKKEEKREEKGEYNTDIITVLELSSVKKDGDRPAEAQ